MRFYKNILRFWKRPYNNTIELNKPVEINTPKEMAKLDLSKINVLDFPKEQYYSAVHDKKQIYLHHTVSGEGVKGDVRHWASSKARVATCVIIDHDGVIHQAFSSKKWAHHLGIKSNIWKKLGLVNKNTKLNQQSIGIEIDSYGGLKKEGDVWKNVYGGTIPNDKVVEYPEGFRGYYAFEKYTEAQIEAVRQLLVFWGERYQIPLDYKGEAMWDLNKSALEGEEGIWAHVSVRPDKSDIHPQADLVDMLKSLQ
jgi:N-acetyl-anhydromuramyl-L-alanine amidase AmpD